MDPWAVLGLSRGATEQEIKEQWRRLCKQHHPDLQPPHMRAGAERHFKELSGAYRTLTARHSSLAAYADFSAASAAAAARGSPYASGFRSAWAAGGQPSKFSNGVVAAVILVPLAITGMWMAFSIGEDHNNQWRPHGLWGPPENPFLRDDMRPRVYSHRRKREEQERLAEQQAAAAADAEQQQLAAAAAAAAAPGPPLPTAASMLPAAATAAMRASTNTPA